MRKKSPTAQASDEVSALTPAISAAKPLPDRGSAEETSTNATRDAPAAEAARAVHRLGDLVRPRSFFKRLPPDPASTETLGRVAVS